MGKLVDLTGQKFGRLTVIKRIKIPNNARNDASWLCECDCDNHTQVIVKRSSFLTKGVVQSCGCLSKEKAKQNSIDNPKKRRFSNECFFENGAVILKDMSGNYCYLDLEDFEKIKKYYWSKNSLGYWRTQFNRKNIYLHQFLLNPPKEVVIDHIDLNKNNNKKENLRICSKAENNRNKKVVGVTFNCSWNKYIAQIVYNRKNYYLGGFELKSEAVFAYQYANSLLFGEYSPYAEKRSTEDLSARKIEEIEAEVKVRISK